MSRPNAAPPMLKVRPVLARIESMRPSIRSATKTAPAKLQSTRQKEKHASSQRARRSDWRITGFRVLPMDRRTPDMSESYDMTSSTDDRVINRVRELRENKLMTQAQLARKAKVALRTIHSVEKGMNCRMDTKRKILLALGLRFEDKDHVFPPLRLSISPEMPEIPGL